MNDVIDRTPASEQIYLYAKSVAEAIDMANKYVDSFRFLAGGTDVLINKFQGNDSAACLIDISNIEELKLL